MKNLNLTPRAQKLIKEAVVCATQTKCSLINSLHFLVAFLNSNHNQISDALSKFKINVDPIKEKALYQIAKKCQKNIEIKTKPILDNETKEMLKTAKILSNKYDHKFVGVEHIFIALFSDPDSLLLEFMMEFKIQSFEKIVSYFEDILQQDEFETLRNIDSDFSQSSGSVADKKSKKFLNEYSVCLNDQISNGKINNLFVNEALIQKLSEILCRKNKNNPLIIGEAGVGKTALVESLAQYIVENKCSDFLALKQIHALDITMIVSGCKYRGEFEEKIKNILKEAVSDPNVVLFIDEIHTIIGAGNPENGMDIANILKPYLARGEISCIGATTFDEYKKTIADDPALSRRFQIIKIEEPSKEDTFKLVKSIKESYEKFHFISYTDETLRYAIDIADKYLQGKFPDKVIDLIDQTGSNIKLQIFKKTPQVLKLEQTIHAAGDKFNKNPDTRNQETVERLLKKYQKIVTKIVEGWQKKKYVVQEKDILNVVSNKTNIPVDELNKQDFEKLKSAKQRLEKEIIGQNTQIDQIYKCLLRAKAGFRNEKKPIASFLFAGPTGVGKTFSSQIIAEELFLNKNSFIHIDMSEYADKTAINKLIGSSPGYIGYEKGGILTEKVKKNPYSIILFDEIQKADPDVLFSLLQILEEGKLMDSYGNTIDFSSCIVILTTNIGSEVLLQNTIGFGNKNNFTQNDILTSLRKYFPADLLNRIDEIIVFNNLQEKEIKLIISKEIDRVSKDLNKKNIDLNYAEEIVDFIFNKIKLQNFGARQVNKTVQRELQTLIAEKILENKNITKINLTISNDKILCNI